MDLVGYLRGIDEKDERNEELRNDWRKKRIRWTDNRRFGMGKVTVISNIRHTLKLPRIRGMSIDYLHTYKPM